MSIATQQLTMIVSAVPGPRFETARPLENTVLRTCGCIEDQLLPHYVHADGWTCSVCGRRTVKPTAQVDGGG